MYCARFPAWHEDGVDALPFQPVVDGVVLSEAPLAAIAAGNAEGVRVLTGTNLTEMTLFTVADPDMATLDDDGILRRLRPVFGDASDRVFAAYRARRPDASPQDLWQELATDGVFRIPEIRLLEAQRGHAPVWSYLFTYETPVFGGILRSSHALEIPFVFDNLDRGGAQLLTGDGPELQGIADAMHRAGSRSPATGDPHHAGIPEWPEYDLERRATMRFNAVCEVVDDPDRDDRLAFEGVTV